MNHKKIMKKSLLLFLVCSVFPVFSATSPGNDFPVEPYTSKATAPEISFITEWRDVLLGQKKAENARYGDDLPFSFMCGDRSSREWVKFDNATITSGDWQTDGTRIHRLGWKDDVTKLACEMELKEFRNRSALQWILRIRNEGTEDSPPVHDVRGVDIQWNTAEYCMPVLHRSIGSPGAEEDFQLRSEIMHSSMWNKSRSMTINSVTNNYWGATHSWLIPTDGRSSAHWLPFFNYQTGNDGLILGLGWSGRWTASFNYPGDKSSTIYAGLDNFNSILHPGEAIRSPLNLVIYWQGEMMHGQNMFRNMVLNYYTPQQNGKFVDPPISGVVWGGIPSKEHLDFIEKIKQYEIPLDVYWFDAGWYGTGVVPSYSVFEGDWGSMAGDWRPNPNWHNGTMKPVSDAAHQLGMDFLVWVEPCRAIQGRPITLEHPEYFLSNVPQDQRNDGETLLLDLGNPVSLQWAIDVLSELIQNYNIDWYEEDFNLDPADILYKYDEPNRTGMREMRFVEGHFKFWDTLLEKFPHLKILNCASGGRRIDLETIARGEPLWRSDYNCFAEATPESTQDQSYNIAYWLPIQGSMIRGWTIFDNYEARSALSPGAENAIVAQTEEQWRQIKSNVEQAKACKKYFYGDYYPLINSPRSLNSWMAYQFYLPEEQEGMILAMRREKSDIARMSFDLLTIDPEKEWTFTDYDTQESWTVSGREIRENGLEIVIPERRSSRLIFYKCK
ncbi:MAG: alpha-galactosidase [Thermoguttaceae bacterium]|nr:alpha-galactosidase [Thermoguttaceae bacterium]